MVRSLQEFINWLNMTKANYVMNEFLARPLDLRSLTLWKRLVGSMRSTSHDQKPNCYDEDIIVVLLCINRESDKCQSSTMIFLTSTLTGKILS